MHSRARQPAAERWIVATPEKSAKGPSPEKGEVMVTCLPCFHLVLICAMEKASESHGGHVIYI